MEKSKIEEELKSYGVFGYSTLEDKRVVLLQSGGLMVLTSTTFLSTMVKTLIPRNWNVHLKSWIDMEETFIHAI